MKTPAFAFLVSVLFSFQNFAANHETMRLREKLHFEDGGEKFRAQSPGYTLELSHETTRVWVGAKRIELRFVGSSGCKNIRSEEPLQGVVNRIFGGDPKFWTQGIKTFGRVRLEEVYPGIDVIFYGNGLELEYDIEVSVGASPDVVSIEFAGADSIAEDGQGGISIRVGDHTLIQRAPAVYQRRDGVRSPVAASYRLDASNRARFYIGNYDPTECLVIDPVLQWSTYFGAKSAAETVNDVAVDALGNIYITGKTFMNAAPEFPLLHAFQDVQSFRDINSNVITSAHAFVTSFTRSGELRFSTYLGGYDADEGVGIAVGSGAASGVYVTGWTLSAHVNFGTSFPTSPNAYITNMATVNPRGIFVSKFSQTGALVYSTLLFKESTTSSAGNAIAVDAQGRAYVVGEVHDVTFQFPTGAANVSGGYIAAVNPEGSALVYTNFVVDRGRVFGVAVETNGIAHLGGSGDAFPTTANAFDRNSSATGFYQKVAANGAVLYGTKFGPESGGSVLDVALAPDGSVVLVGGLAESFAQPPYFPFTPTNGFQMTFGGGSQDGFVARLDSRIPGKGGLLMASFFGGKGDEIIREVAVGGDGNIYITGDTTSTNLPLVGAVQTSLVGSNDAFAAQINAAGSGLVFSTYLGGSGVESGLGVAAVPHSSSFVVVGNTTSTNFPTLFPFQGLRKGDTNGFISRFGTEPPEQTFTVNSANDVDDGACDTAHCSLREAIKAANQLAGVQTIIFDIPGEQVPSIHVNSPLPTIIEPVVINGRTQPITQMVEIDGANAGAGVDGIQVQASNTTLAGLAIGRFGGNGIILRGGGGNVIYDCIVGMDWSAFQARPNGGNGILIDDSGGNLIGDLGNSTNVIAANGKDGIRIQGGDSNDNAILATFIGRNDDDGGDLGNHGHGISILNGKGNWIGSELSLPNYICGSGSNGVYIASPASATFIAGNHIGFGAQIMLGNAGHGIEIFNSAKNLIGGSSPAACNFISGSGKSGIYIHGFAHENKIQGNLIGLHKFDFEPPPLGGNEGDGILITDGSNRTIIGGPTTQRGFGAGNVIVGNRSYGVSIDSQSEGTIIEGNVIGTDRQSGTKRLGNSLGGIRTFGPGTRIGGPKEAQGNLISGHDHLGISVEGSLAATTIQGNKIGVTIGGGGINLNSDALDQSFFEIKVLNSEKVWIGGELSAGALPGEPPGNIIGGGIDLETVNASAILGNSIGFDHQGEFLSAARVDLEGSRNRIGASRASNEISGGIHIRGSKNIVQANRLGITRSGSTVTNNETRDIVLLDSSSETLIGGRNTGEPNSIIGGRDGVAVAFVGGGIGGNSILGNEIRDFKQVAISTNNLAQDRMAAPIIVNSGPDSPFSSDGMAVVSFEPFAPGEYGEVEVFGSTAPGLTSPRPDALKLIGRAKIPEDGTLSNVFVRLREVSFDAITATVTKKGRTTSPLADRVNFLGGPDADNDGVPDRYELLGDGDGNNDGIQDNQQGNVWGFPAYNGAKSFTVDLKTSGSLGFARPREDLPPPIIPDKSLKLDLGMPYEFQIGIRAQDGKIGKAKAPLIATVEIFFPAGTQPNAFLLYQNFEWAEFTFDGTTGAQFLSDRVVLHFVDNQRGDEAFFPENTIKFVGMLATILNSPPPLHIDEVQKGPGDELFLRYSGPSATYWLQESANLSSWTSILTNPPSAGTNTSLFIGSSTNNVRFFRISEGVP